MVSFQFSLPNGGKLKRHEWHKEHARHQFNENGGVQPTGFRDKLLRKVLASARADTRAAADALDLFRICRLDKVSLGKIGHSHGHRRRPLESLRH